MIGKFSFQKKKDKKLHYELTKNYFIENAVDKRGYYRSKNVEEIKNDIQKREMWDVYTSILKNILQDNPELTSVADIGCGMGNFCIELTQHKLFNKIVGLDFLKETFNLTNDNLSLFQNVDFIQADLLDIPFKSKSFDVVFCLNTLHHIHPLDFKRAIRELAIISKKYIVLEIRNKKNVFNFLYNYAMLSNLYRDLPLYSYSISYVSNLMKKYNFKLEFLSGKKRVNWLCRRVVLNYKTDLL
jgi:ubiquinone/menaquinone biosynthesis C-methylase UbiE